MATKTRFTRIKIEEDLYRKLTKEEKKLMEVEKSPNKEDLLDCIGGMRGALELLIAKMEQDASIPTQGTLYERIVALEQQNYLDRAAAEYAHKVRMITNEAVHFWGKSVDDNAKKFLDDQDDDGLIQIAEEMLNKLAVLSEYYINEFQVALEERGTTKPQTILKKESTGVDPFLYCFFGIMGIALVMLLITSLF